jgi:hypothetical protein
VIGAALHDGVAGLETSSVSSTSVISPSRIRQTPPTLGPAAVADFIRDDVARWTRLVDAVGLEKLREGGAAQ